MSTNCSKTKLKESINNDNLPLLDNLHINVHSQTTFNNQNNKMAIVVPVTGAKAIIKGDGYFTDEQFQQDLGKESSLTRNGRIRFSNGDYKIFLPLTGWTQLWFDAYQALSSITDLQTDGLDYSRLLALNPGLTKLIFKKLKQLTDNYKNSAGLTQIAVTEKPEQSGVSSADTVIQSLVECSGRSVNFGIMLPNGYADYYGDINGTSRNVHIVTQYTKYQVYNTADTQLLYTVEKINGVWTPTMA